MSILTNDINRERFVFGSICIAVILITVFFPIGFRGADDYQYLLAAERWMTEGPNVGENHWANRLPYVWGWAASFALFGKTEISLRIFHGVLLALLTYLAWLIGSSELKNRRAAYIGMIAVLFTPIVFRLSTFYYPEAVEIPALALCSLFVLNIDRFQPSRRTGALFVAGLIGGLAVLVRQTAVALPIALAITMLVFKENRTASDRIKEIMILAAGFLTPVISELVFYRVMTGDWLHRFIVDSSHAKISGAIMKGGALSQYDSALFNWRLGHEWNRETIVPVFWFLSPLVRLFASPGVLLLPWLALAGGIIAWREGGRPKRLAFFVFCVIFVQYLINTFVLVTAPNNRYFGVGLLLMGPLAGFTIARVIPKPFDLVATLLIFIAPSCLLAVLQPHPSERALAIEKFATSVGQPVSLNQHGQRLLAMRFRGDEALREKLPSGPAPVNGLLAVWSTNPDPQLLPLCASGNVSLEQFASLRPEVPIERSLRTFGIYDRLPKKLQAVASRTSETTIIYRRLC